MSSIAPDAANFEPLSRESIPSAWRLSTQAGWNQTGDDWGRLMRFDGKSGPYEIEPLHLLAYHGNFRKCVAGGDNFDGAFSPGDSVWKRDQINTKGIHCAPAVRHA